MGWISAEASLAQDLENPEFRELWAQSALADVVSRAVLAYRIEHGLSQTALAKELGLKQPAVSRLEIGEVDPSIETLRRLSSVLGMEFLISIAPSGRPKLLGKEAERAGFSERIDSNGSYLFIAAD
jgi:transcriptional regulator with XRE-family HTH domain